MQSPEHKCSIILSKLPVPGSAEVATLVANDAVIDYLLFLLWGASITQATCRVSNKV
jgi:hypothetical protein